MTHILVTGGGRGIGHALCLAALARGWTVTATVRHPGSAPWGVREAVLDLTDLAALPVLAGSIGPLDVLVNNAGVMGPAASAAAPVDPVAFLDVVRINTLVPLAVTQAFLPNLRASPSGRGRVLAISSQMAWSGYARSDYIAYRASKAALNKVVQGLATDLRPDGIVAVAVDPGSVRTGMGGPSADLSPEESARSLLDLAETLTPDHSGQFLRHDGTRRDW